MIKLYRVHFPLTTDNFPGFYTFTLFLIINQPGHFGEPMFSLAKYFVIRHIRKVLIHILIVND